MRVRQPQNLGLGDIAARRTHSVSKSSLEWEGIMSKASTALIHRYAGVAIVAALISGFGTFTATRFVTASSAQPAPAAAAKPLLVQPLGDLPGREIRITLLDRAPGSYPELGFGRYRGAAHTERVKVVRSNGRES